jgi:hypothetical protein
MAETWRPVGAIVTSVDVSPTVGTLGPDAGLQGVEAMTALLRDMWQMQRQQLEIAREMLALAKENRQRQQAELEAWQRENQGVVERCRDALGSLVRVHAGMIGDMADYVNDNAGTMLESDFALSEFVDRFGPRLHHLSAVLSVLKQVSTPSPESGGSSNSGATRA